MTCLAKNDTVYESVRNTGTRFVLLPAGSHRVSVLLQQPLRSLRCAQGWKHLQIILPGWGELAQNGVNQTPAVLLVGAGAGNQQRDQNPENHQTNKVRSGDASQHSSEPTDMPPKCWAGSCPRCPLALPSRDPACPRCPRAGAAPCGVPAPPPPLLVLQ